MLNFDIDGAQLDLVSDALGATPQQVRLSFNRALRRTAATLRKLSSKGLKSELDLRNLKALRRRLRTISVKRGRDLESVILWYGTNDLPISAFKGRPRKTSGWVAFRDQVFREAFIARSSSGKLSVFKRRGAARLPIIEQTMPVKDKMDVYLEDEVFVDIESIFFNHFRSDLRGRTIIGANGRGR